ncbi:sugar ABC transporter permease [Pengzhenrongella sp.]|uniref:carbohydrate ABC transporter permease n=1 Tax=Pengzhenrongella sp. TaxID=2888820 RepID=UPI002F947819
MSQVAVLRAPRAATVRSGPTAGARWGRRAEIALFVGPALALYVLFVLLPIALAAFYSLFKWNGIESLTNFVGIENYQRALADPTFRGALTHNLVIVAGSIVIQLPVALGLALLLNRKMRGRAVLRTIIFVPYVLSEVITGVIWLLMLQPAGLVDRIFDGLGLGGLTQLWLADPKVVLFTMLAVISWKYVGFAMILFLAGLQGVPKELHEAASIDGASWWQAQRSITLPLLAPTIRIWVFLSMIGSLQLFDLVWIMTGGGPANASNTMATYMIERGFQRGQFGYGTAVAVILFSISFVAAMIYQRFVLRRDNEGALTGRVG